MKATTFYGRVSDERLRIEVRPGDRAHYRGVRGLYKVRVVQVLDEDRVLVRFVGERGTRDVGVLWLSFRGRDER